MRRILLKECLAIACMDDGGTEYQSADLLIDGRTITAVGPAVAAALASGPTPDEVVDARYKVALPGFVNTHHHMFQTLTRAVPAVQDAKLFDWLVSLYQDWKHLTPEWTHLSALVAMGELLLTGCTTSSDHFYLFPKDSPDDLLDGTIRASRELGIRFHPTRGSMSLGESAGGLPPDSCTQSEAAILKDCERVISAWHDPEPLSMCRVGLAPCSPFSVTDDLMIQSAELARIHGLQLHTHLAETLDEETFCLETKGLRPLALMDKLGWLGDDVWFAHGVHFDDAELGRLAHTHTGIAHCPSSNLRLGSGTCRVPDLLQRGVPVGLGVDGSASNDSSNMLAEVRMALLAHRESDSTRTTARQVLRMATRGGAEVLGRDDIGQLAPGKAADVVLFDLEEIGFAGALHDPIGALVFCGTSGRVHTSIVNGEFVVRDRRLVGGDEKELFHRARQLTDAMVARKQS
ncbi:MAG: 8-oxoguanine deaminase [Myxococcota bacterium]|jgi:8-oxoguanine deaminase